MTKTQCALCGGPVADLPTPHSRFVRVQGTTGCLVIADGEYPLHRCETLDPLEEQDLLREAGELFNNEHLKDLPDYE